MKKTFFSFSFGCRVNQAEKEQIDKELAALGWSYSEANPKLIIINSCCVTAKAEREARQLIYQLKKRFPQAKLVLTGCAATYWQKHNFYANLPVDLIVDNKNKNSLVSLLKSNQLLPTNTNLAGWSRLAKSGRSLLKIQDGCQRYCSYCIVPYLRGLPKSKPIKEIVNEINSLDKSTKEVILTAINTEAYGYDTKESFIALLKTIIDQTKIKRISMGSIHPWSINNEFFQFYQQYLPFKRLVNFFHIPLQSGSNKILKLMKRGYTREEFITKLNRLHTINPNALIATDIIVGFLGETNKDFQDTYDFLKNSSISKFHIFRYSPRKNTAAYFLGKSIKEPSYADKIKRSHILIKLSQDKYEEFLKQQINRVSNSLFLEKRIGNYQQGLLDNQIPILIKADKNYCGQIKNTKVIALKSGKLFGKII